jgi:hypothetical protein
VTIVVPEKTIYNNQCEKLLIQQAIPTSSSGTAVPVLLTIGTATLQLVDRCGNSVFSDQLKPRRIYDIRIHTASKLATVLCNLPKCTVGVTPVLNNPTTSTPAVSSKD